MGLNCLLVNQFLYEGVYKNLIIIVNFDKYYWILTQKNFIAKLKKKIYASFVLIYQTEAYFKQFKLLQYMICMIIIIFEIFSNLTYTQDLEKNHIFSLFLCIYISEQSLMYIIQNTKVYVLCDIDSFSDFWQFFI